MLEGFQVLFGSLEIQFTKRKKREREKIKPLAVLMKYHVSHNYTSWGKVRV